MKRLKITIKPTSSFISEMQSDTVFGHFCWAWRDIFGEESLQKNLKGYDERPFIVFSSAFPSDMLPLPILPSVEPKVFESSLKNIFPNEDAAKVSAYFGKKQKKNNLIAWNELQLALSENITSESLLVNYMKGCDYKNGKLMPTKEEGLCEKELVFKNSISRETGTTVKGGGSLYHFSETFFNEKQEVKLDIYSMYDDRVISAGAIEEVFSVIGKTGFGKDKSTGKGRFEICAVVDEPKELAPHCKNPNGFISLSCGVSDQYSDLLYGKTFTKFGKHGGTMAVQGKHIKNPIIMYKPGSTFTIKEQKPFYGKGVELDPMAKGHFHSAFMVPLFCRFEVSND